MGAGVPKLMQPLDKLCNRQIDLTTLTANEEYKEKQIKNTKVLLKK